jgi:hypothetical protein
VYETAAASAGEIRLYLDTVERVILQELQSALGYGYGSERDHRTLTDPWEYALGDARHIVSEVGFSAERDRVIHILLAQIAAGWDADLLYYPPRQGSAIYHWSSAEGTLHPYRTVNE